MHVDAAQTRRLENWLGQQQTIGNHHRDIGTQRRKARLLIV